MAVQDKKKNFIVNCLPKLILERNEELNGYKIIKCTATPNSQLDGFMAAIYSMELDLENTNGEIENHQIILKIMKGDQDFRERTCALLQSSNEIFIYKNVIPYFKKFLNKCRATTIDPDKWVPRIYYADYKIFRDLSNEQESILAVENLTYKGFRLGPRLDINEEHLILMIKNIASYHAVSYAMKILGDPMFEELSNGLNPFDFLSPDGSEMQSYNILYRIGLERVFTVSEKTKDILSNEELTRTIKNIKTKLYERPVVFLQKLLTKDKTFCVFLHGDYNRNNVLFRYENADSFDNPQELRMIDYQETRVATPVIDLAFFIYMNMPSSEHLWDKLIDLYHNKYIECVVDILKCDTNDPRLKPYNYNNFINHFTNHAFLGVITCFHFVPFMACSGDECEKISHLFETDMKSDEFRQILQVCGGSNVDERLLSILRHSYNKGYLKIFDD